MRKRWVLNTFWLSVLLHLLILLIISFNLFFKSKEQAKKSPQLYVPAYVYKGAIQPSVAQRQVPQVKPQHIQRQEQLKETAETKELPIEEKPIKENLPTSKQGIHKRSFLAASFQMLQEQQINNIRTALANTEPIYLIGDDSHPADPLIKLLGRALSAHFNYPKMAGEFGIRGRVLVGLILHPEGYITDVQILKSSNNDDLDAAALYAVNEAPTIRGADRFLSEPKHFVIGFIFN